MKLKNKKTGEIVEWFNNTDGIFPNSLAELNEEWEDVPEEPKEYWHIAEMCAGLQKKQDTDNGEDRFNKQIGNCFETKEEAEKAVEKLKAWKRLKDKGFRFTGVAGISNNIYVSFETDSKYRGGHVMYDKYSDRDDKLREYNEDLMLLFGGEE